MLENRLEELETKLAFAEDLIETLNQTAIRQQKQMDSLQEQLRLLHREMRDNRTEESTSLREEIPPHY